MAKKAIKLLLKSKRNRIVTGLFGGLGEYLEIDATVLRLIFILLTAFTGFVPGLLVYVIAAMVVPEE